MEDNGLLSDDECRATITISFKLEHMGEESVVSVYEYVDVYSLLFGVSMSCKEMFSLLSSPCCKRLWYSNWPWMRTPSTEYSYANFLSIRRTERTFVQLLRESMNIDYTLSKDAVTDKLVKDENAIFSILRQRIGISCNDQDPADRDRDRSEKDKDKEGHVHAKSSKLNYCALAERDSLSTDVNQCLVSTSKAGLHGLLALYALRCPQSEKMQQVLFPRHTTTAAAGGELGQKMQGESCESIAAASHISDGDYIEEIATTTSALLATFGSLVAVLDMALVGLEDPPSTLSPFQISEALLGRQGQVAKDGIVNEDNDSFINDEVWAELNRALGYLQHWGLPYLSSDIKSVGRHEMQGYCLLIVRKLLYPYGPMPAARLIIRNRSMLARLYVMMMIDVFHVWRSIALYCCCHIPLLVVH